MAATRTSRPAGTTPKTTTVTAARPAGRAAAAALVCVCAGAVLTGCSGDGGGETGGGAGARKVTAAATDGATAGPFRGLSADQIADRAVAATEQAPSLRMKGEIESGGDLVTVDLAMDSRADCTGRLGVQGGRADVRRLGEVVYMKGDDAFWRAAMRSRPSASPDDGSGDAVVELVKDRWVKLPAGAVEDLRGLCDLDEMLAGLKGAGGISSGLTLGRDGAVGGARATTLVKRNGSATVTAYVAQEGEPYLLKVVRAGGEEPGGVTFSDYGKPVAVTAPPAGEVVDLEGLLGDPDPDADPDGTSPAPEQEPDPELSPEPDTESDPDTGGDTGFNAGSRADDEAAS
ncbi:hypothetical protein [Streptomyces sp. NPDC005805]|uniref:hypothetical protein n=1 Tax=Streptomyces sp. NPDC005805 TaxID=3157068 RepID=UPI0034089A4E